jgi:hypothetical protein
MSHSGLRMRIGDFLSDDGCGCGGEDQQQQQL